MIIAYDRRESSDLNNNEKSELDIHMQSTEGKNKQARPFSHLSYKGNAYKSMILSYVDEDVEAQQWYGKKEDNRTRAVE